jgi:hypothetical protein
MLSYSIQNSNNLSSQIEELLAHDLEYIKSHNNSNYSWGNCTGNLSSKFRQYDDLELLPVFNELLSADVDIVSVVLSTLKPSSTKIIQNTNYLGELTNASIIIPIGFNQTANYVWYNPAYITQHNIRSLLVLRKEHGNKIIDGSCVIENGYPLLIKHQNYWAAVSNKQDNDFDFLQISLSNNTSYEEVKTYFGVYSGSNPGTGPKS